MLCCPLGVLESATLYLIVCEEFIKTRAMIEIVTERDI